MVFFTRLKESYKPVTEDKQCQHISHTCTKNNIKLHRKTTVISKPTYKGRDISDFFNLSSQATFTSSSRKKEEKKEEGKERRKGKKEVKHS